MDIREAYVIKVVLNRTNFNLYYKYLSALNLEKETKFILDNIKAYFEEYPSIEDIKVEELLLHIYNSNKITKRNTLFESVLIQAANADINDEVLQENFSNFIEQYFASEILYLIAEKQEDNGHEYLEDVENIIQAYKDATEAFKKDTTSDATFVSHDISSARKKKNDTPGLSWNLHSLDLHIGPLRGTSLGHVFARVDTGKTSFILNLIRTWIPQLQEDERILYLNNEEDGEKLMDRLSLSVLGLTSQEANSRIDELTPAFEEAGGTKCLLHDNALIYISDIENMVSANKVRAIVIDQADKLHFKGERNLSDVQRLQMIYAKLREISKKHKIDIVTVGQAGVTAENKKWLQPSDIDGSKTLKPGEFDYIIGIGKAFSDSGSALENTRYLHICKNKMGTGIQAKSECYIDTQRARYMNENTLSLINGGGYEDYSQQGGQQHQSTASAINQFASQA